MVSTTGHCPTAMGFSHKLRRGKEAVFHENITSSSSVPTCIPLWGLKSCKL